MLALSTPLQGLMVPFEFSSGPFCSGDQNSLARVSNEMDGRHKRRLAWNWDLRARGMVRAEASPVAHYRVYLLDPDGHIKRAVDLDCENDRAAEAQAKQLVDHCDVELWQGGRRIALFEPPKRSR